MKVYGIRFIILMGGYGRKFNVVPLFMNIGSGIALFSVATLIVDILMCYIAPKHDFYSALKYRPVNDEDGAETDPLLAKQHTHPPKQPKQLQQA